VADIRAAIGVLAAHGVYVCVHTCWMTLSKVAG
jgi:hypothetical protein